MIEITASVGKDGFNTLEDTRIIQNLINENIGSIIPFRLLLEDGIAGQRTIQAIREFQIRVVGLPAPDGRVDPDGLTWLALKKDTGQEEPENIPTEMTNPVVSYSTSLASTKKIVSEYAISVIKLALKKAEMPHAVITSTIRTPEEQANIMYRNASQNLEKQFRLYGPNGDNVLKVYKTNKTKSKPLVIGLMKDKIEELLKQGKRTSKHVITPSQYSNLNIIDIGVNSTRRASGSAFSVEKLTQTFTSLVRDGYIEKLIDETKKSNQCWHIEIIPNKKAIPS